MLRRAIERCERCAGAPPDSCRECARRAFSALDRLYRRGIPLAPGHEPAHSVPRVPQAPGTPPADLAHLPTLPAAGSELELILTVPEVADVLRVDPSTVYRLIRRRELRAFVVGRRRVVAESSLRLYLARHRR